jgi:hypothetical protein
MCERYCPSGTEGKQPARITWSLTYAERRSIRRIYLALEREADALGDSLLAVVWAEMAWRVSREFAAMSPDGDLNASA